MSATPADIVMLIACLVVLPIVVANVLDRLGLVRASVLGGLIVGVIVGPTVFGRLAPQTWENVFRGGVQQRVVLEAARRELQRDERAIAETDMPLDQFNDELAPKRDAVDEAQDAYDTARWQHNARQRSIVAAIVFGALLIGGLIDRGPPTERLHAGPIAALSIGAWSALPGALAYFVLRWFEVPMIDAGLAAAALAIGPWRLVASDQQSAREAEYGGAALMRAAGRVASVLAISVFIWLVMMSEVRARWLFIIPLGALAVGWLIPVVLSGDRAIELIEILVLAPLAATVSSQFDLIAHFSVWPILLFVLLSADGRWFGAYIGALLPGQRNPLRTMRLVLAACAAGPTQLAVIALALQATLISPEVAYAGAVGAVMIEVTTPMRRKAAVHMRETEEEIQHLDDDF